MFDLSAEWEGTAAWLNSADLYVCIYSSEHDAWGTPTGAGVCRLQLSKSMGGPVSENVRKLIGVAVMAAIVVVGVVVTNDDDSDFTRNRALRRGAESTSTSSNDSVATALGSSTESGEVRNQSDATSLRSESSGTVETATRLDGGNELATADCCDQNAYEILKLQNQYADIEEQLERISETLLETEDSLAEAEEVIEKLQDESCSSIGAKHEQIQGDFMASRCAYIAHKEMVAPVDNVSAVWVKESSGSTSCKVGEGIVNWGLGWLEDQIGIDTGKVDLCSSTWTTQPKNMKSPIKSSVLDKYFLFTLQCPNVANFVPKDHNLYSDVYSDPQIFIQQLDATKAKYWIAPQSESGHSNGTWQLGLDASNIAKKKQWGAGLVQHLAGWTFDREAMDIYGSSKDDSFATTGVTVIIEDLETGEHHYAYVTASVAYRVLAENKQQLQEGEAKGRCEGDVTIIRSYA